MNMQDKEFDDLFRSKLDNFEVEPSAQVWQNIDTELSGRKRKSIFPMLGIAASVLILLIAGILFIPKNRAVKHNRPDSNKVAVNKVRQAIVKQVAALKIPVKHINKVSQSEKMKNTIGSKAQYAQVIAKEETVKPEQQPVLAAVNKKAEDDTKQIELDPAPSALKHNDNDATISIPSQPVLALAQTPAEKVPKPAVKKRGIHNFGDLVNLVVAKVDKRKDKLIQFTDTDDDESMISAVHLGTLKIKKDN
jgi:hypothetical protein